MIRAPSIHDPDTSQVFSSPSYFAVSNIMQSRDKAGKGTCRGDGSVGRAVLSAGRSSSSCYNHATAPQSVLTSKRKLDIVAPVQQPFWWPCKIIFTAAQSKWRGVGGNDWDFLGTPLPTACGYVQMDQLIGLYISHDAKDSNDMQQRCFQSTVFIPEFIFHFFLEPDWVWINTMSGDLQNRVLSQIQSSPKCNSPMDPWPWLRPLCI